MATIGQQLKAARNERGLTIEDVAFHTRIPAARVRDMENDDLSRFANLTYARGFLKLYGEFLELDLSDFLAQFRTEEFAHASGHEYVQTANATQNLPAAVFVDHGRARRPGLYILALMVLAAGIVVWWNKNDEAPEPAKAAAREPLPPEPPAPEPAESASLIAAPEPPAPVAVEVKAVFSATATETRLPPPVSPSDKPSAPPKAKVVAEEEPEAER